MTLSDNDRARLRQAILDQPAAALEDIARAAGCSTAEVVASLPEGQAVIVPGTHFARVIEDVTGWGEVTFIVNTGDVILEVKAEVPKGSEAKGFFNLHGKPLGGHIRANACATIAFVSRKLFDSETKSVQFYGKDGACMFKIYLGRDERRQLLPEQVAAFDALRAELAPVAA
ncbi:heme utilization cystosolic carrier protein HutX [Afifella pfennigii]|uniref:heme utilization cystosolic carrier protein HutX n=1 Tax=Afifella pfennigii TaxID=209897 RepID=UPI00047BA8CA|nr:heme utilization cystosolic carrier protein HutX [Afifella pfennigii]